MSAPTRTRLLAGTWTVAAQHSTATFSYPHVFTRVHGSFPVLSGTVGVGPDGEPASVVAELSTEGVATGHPRRDRDLRRRFLGSADHPTMSYRSSAVRADGPCWVVEGSLQVREAAAAVRLRVEVVDTAPDRVRVVATGTVDRYAAGVRTAPSWLIGRLVEVRVEAELRRL